MLAARKRKEPAETKQERPAVESLVEEGEEEEEEDKDDADCTLRKSADRKMGDREFVCARSCWH